MDTTRPLTRTAPTTYAIDELDGQTVTATAAVSGYHGQAVIVLDTDADATFRKNTANLTPAAARALAAKLVELADLADEFDDA
jgi:hypothetical protein